MKTRILAGALVAVVASLGLYPSDPPVIRGFAQAAPPTIRDLTAPGPTAIPGNGANADPDPGHPPTPIVRG